MPVAYLTRIYTPYDPDTCAHDQDLLVNEGWIVDEENEDIDGNQRVVYRRTVTDTTDLTSVSHPQPVSIPRMHRYRIHEVMLLVAGSAIELIGLVVTFNHASLFRLVLAFVVFMALIISFVDQPGFLSLRGRFALHKMTNEFQILMMIAWIAASPLLLPYYAARVFWQYYHNQNFASVEHTRYLEHILGIGQPAIGYCARCAMVIPIGTTVCIYCQEPLYTMKERGRKKIPHQVRTTMTPTSSSAKVL